MEITFGDIAEIVGGRFLGEGNLNECDPRREGSIFIIGGQGSHMRPCYLLLILWSVWLCAFFNCLVEIVVLLSTRNSCLGIPSPFKIGLFKELGLHFSTFRLEAKHPPSAIVLFLQQYNIVLQGVAVGVHNTTSRDYLSEEEALFPLGDQ